MGKRTDRESPIQIAIVQWLRAVLPPGCIVHHARGEINKRGKSVMMELAKAKRKGAMAGFPDLVVLPYSACGPIFFEVKAEGQYTSKSQKEMHAALRNLGYPVDVVRSIDDVRECLQAWGVGFREVT